MQPVLLTVYEKHFVPLGRQIKPGLNGLLLGLLPGLEEGAEYYDRYTVMSVHWSVNQSPINQSSSSQPVERQIISKASVICQTVKQLKVKSVISHPSLSQPVGKVVLRKGGPL